MESSGAETNFGIFLKDRLNLTNLGIFIFLFSSASFNYYLINFYLKYIPGNVYVNTIVASIAEFVSTLIAGSIVKYLGIKNTISSAFALNCISGVILWIAEKLDSTGSVPVIILAAKFGNCASFGLLYMSTLHYFPSQFLGAVFGACNVTARAITIASPLVAEASEPVPELFMILSCLFAAIFTRFLRQPKGLLTSEAKPNIKAIED